MLSRHEHIAIVCACQYLCVRSIHYLFSQNVLTLSSNVSLFSVMNSGRMHSPKLKRIVLVILIFANTTTQNVFYFCFL